MKRAEPRERAARRRDAEDDGGTRGRKGAPEPREREPKDARDPAPRPPHDDERDDPPMTLWDHLSELRGRIVKSVLAVTAGTIVAWFFKDRILGIMVQPLERAWKQNEIPGDLTLHFTSVVGAFMNYLKLAILVGLVVGAPVVFYQLWRFIAPGLYRREKRYVIPFVLATSILFACGCVFGYFVAFPYAFEWLLSLAGPIDTAGARLTPTLMMSEYVDLVAKLSLAFGAVFEIPIITLALSLVGVINYLHLVRFFRWWIVIAFVVAAVITPPDLGTTQLLMAAPMIALYGLSIGLCYLLGKPPTDAQREAYAEQKRERREAREKKRQKARRDAGD
ncbi:MAG: twin-arginine translocase subunit TatC [Polyangiaceae bacterium]|nr:twin-arginine translocase subunit TatC [Polyangiaceae bacterium]